VSIDKVVGGAWVPTVGTIERFLTLRECEFVALATASLIEHDDSNGPGSVICPVCEVVRAMKWKNGLRLDTKSDFPHRDSCPVQLAIKAVDGFAARAMVDDAAIPLDLKPENAVAAPVALDVSLERARALHRVWRALNDGDCPRCHRFHAATEIIRTRDDLECPSCGFFVTRVEIEEIEKLFAPAMNAAVDIFMKWRSEKSL
jgi:hypothetical protein